MISDITKFPLFDNMLFLDVTDNHYDLHNDYQFERMIFSNEVLNLTFKNDNKNIIITFLSVDFEYLDIGVLSKEPDLILDNLYRGRFQKNEQLLEQDELGRNYYYLEFTEDIKFEFFASSAKIEVF